MPDSRMDQRKFSWLDPKFTYGDALTGSRLIMLPYLIYGLVAHLAGLVAVTYLIMVGTDLTDGRIARRLGQSRTFGGVFDSTVDFVVIYALFTALFAVGMLPWWKWIVIFAPAVLMATTQILHVLTASEVAFAPVRVGKLVGQIQYLYLPFLLARKFWLAGAGWRTVDHVVFAILTAAIVFNTIDHLRILAALLRRRPSGRRAHTG